MQDEIESLHRMVLGKKTFYYKWEFKKKKNNSLQMGIQKEIKNAKKNALNVEVENITQYWW